jgi:3-oxoacyl-[acyl-carrier protein] reductase
MLKDIDGQRVLITGASSGIGAAAARAFAAHGARVAIHYNANRAGAEGILADCPGGVLVTGDLRDATAANAVVVDAIAALGGLDLLINNAGDVMHKVPVTELPDALIDDVLHLNLHSMVICSRAALRHFVDRKAGCIISTSSVGARHGGSSGVGIYAGAKAFVNSFTRHLAREYAPLGIRVNAVSPGVVATPIHERHSTPELMETYRKAIPMGRVGTPGEVAGTFLYLASPSLSGFVTGQVIEVNGGQYMV